MLCECELTFLGKAICCSGGRLLINVLAAFKDFTDFNIVPEFDLIFHVISLVDFEYSVTADLFGLLDLFSKNLEISWIEEISVVSVNLSAVVAKGDAKFCSAISFNVHDYLRLLWLWLYYTRLHL
jgi:hypothetical protein